MRHLLHAAALLAAIGGAVHLCYAHIVRPAAEAAIQAARSAGQSAPRELVVILKDWEQEICIVLAIFCAIQILTRMWSLMSEQYLFEVDIFDEVETAESRGGGSADKKAAVEKTLREIDALPDKMRNTQLMETLKASLRRYRITEDVQNTSDAIQTSVEALDMRLEADNAMIRYIIWAIPSIGFVGTVRGIGQALSQADEALAGDIAGMTAHLGTAFNSTLVALIASLVLMLILHALRRAQDRRLLQIQDYCEERLLRRISV